MQIIANPALRILGEFCRLYVCEMFALIALMAVSTCEHTAREPSAVVSGRVCEQQEPFSSTR